MRCSRGRIWYMSIKRRKYIFYKKNIETGIFVLTLFFFKTILIKTKHVWQRNCLYQINLFMKPVLHFKMKTLGLLSALLLIASFNASAQKKSVYDVIPGSGPKKTPTSKNVVIFGGRKTYPRQNTYPVYTTRRKNLPPGQAKKIYGGSAKDYAPGQVKKHYEGWNRGHEKEHDGKEHDRNDHSKNHDRDD